MHTQFRLILQFSSVLVRGKRRETAKMMREADNGPGRMKDGGEQLARQQFPAKTATASQSQTSMDQPVMLRPFCYSRKMGGMLVNEEEEEEAVER
jgi:carbamoylphosphate synthase large subunit